MTTAPLFPLALTTLEKINQVPKQFWLYAAGAAVALIALVILFRFLSGANKIYLTIIIAMICSFVGFNWVYERNEPKFLTPVVDVLAQFLPSKGAYATTQQQEAAAPKKPLGNKPKAEPAPAKK